MDVSVVYFRAGYEPGHYPTQDEWDARYLIEISKAIKCPSIHYHLAGTKKVQQALAKPGMLNRFLTDDTKIKSIQDIFTGLYSLDSNTEEGKNSFKMALINPSKYRSKQNLSFFISVLYITYTVFVFFFCRFVLKPQREGGGNNVYGHDIPDALSVRTIVAILLNKFSIASFFTNRK